MDWQDVKIISGLVIGVIVVGMAVFGFIMMIHDAAEVITPKTTAGAELISEIDYGSFIRSEKTGFSFIYREDENMIYTDKAQIIGIGSVTAIVGERVTIRTFDNGVKDIYFETSKTILISK